MNPFNKEIVSFKEKYLGMDLSDLSVKLIQLHNDGSRDKIMAYSSQDIPTGCIEDGRIINKVKAIEVIRSAVRNAGPKKVNTKKVICSLPESKVFLRILTIPIMAEEEIGEAIKWEIEASIPLSIDQVYYDWQLIGKYRNGQSILTVAIAKEVVDGLVEILEGAGLEVHGLEAESIAMSRSLIVAKNTDLVNEVAQGDKNKKDDAPVNVSLIVDLGAQRTGFILTEENIPFFTSSIPFSSIGITSVIARILGISDEDAEKIKITQGVSACSINDNLSDSICAYFESLATEIEKSIDFYQSINKADRSPKVENIIICGGGANLKGLIPYLVKRLGRKVQIGDPWVNLDFGNNLPIINKEKASQFATAIGLAMKKK